MGKIISPGVGKGRYPRPTTRQRLECKTVKLTCGCHIYFGKIAKNGYGHIWENGQTALAHRVAWKISNGPIPDGMQLDHICRTRSCVNPNHLELVTCRENLRRGHNANRDKTHCPRGHSYVGGNVHISPNGSRDCRECWRIENFNRRRA